MLTRKNIYRKGFTLIELLVVILILAILAALIVPNLIGHTDDAKRAKALTDITVLNEAATRFRQDVGRYPTTEEGFGALRNRPSNANTWNGPYVEKSVPADPWGNEYVYEDNGEQRPLIKSFGADGAEGGSGNAADISNQDEEGSNQQQPTQ